MPAKTTVPLLAITVSMAVSSGSAFAQTFLLEGTDAVMGVGARYLAMGGTGTSTANDPHAVFYNASLLTGIDRVTIAGTRQLDAELRPYTFIGIAVPLPFLEDSGFNITLGAARYNRVHSRSSGAFGANEPESIFLRYLLPGISGTYDGDIDSKTLVNRFALGLSHEALSKLSFGANVDLIDCKTNSCGVHAGSNGYEVQSVGATAVSFGVSTTYRPNNRLTFGASYTDIGATLKVNTVTTDNTGTRRRLSYSGLPSQLRLEASYIWNDQWLLATGYQKMWGAYGNYVLNYETINFGAEFQQNDVVAWRGGFWAPVQIKSSQGVNFNFPYGLPTIPVPTVGVGLDLSGVEVDLAAHLNPLMTLHKEYPVISAELTLTYTF